MFISEDHLEENRENLEFQRVTSTGELRTGGQQMSLTQS